MPMLMPTVLWNAARALRRRPVFALVSTALLSLGVGAVCAIFSLVDVALLRPLPYADPVRLEALKSAEPVRGDSTAGYNLAAEQFVRWRAESKLFVGIEGAVPKSIALVGAGDPEALPGMQVSAGMFALLGAAPARGRPFTRDDEIAGSTVAIVSDDFWRQRLHARPDVIGTSLVLDGIARTVIGVMPPQFSVLFLRSDIWLPLSLDQQARSRRLRTIATVGRLAPGVTAAQAAQEIDRINTQIGAEIPLFRRSRSRIVPLRDDLFGDDRGPLVIIGAAVLVLLVIACINVLNLTFSDALARRQTTMVHLALGASPSRVIDVRVVEGGIIASVAALIGLTIGRIAVIAFASVDPRYFADFGDLAINHRTVVAGVLTAAIGGAFATLPVAFTESRLRITTLASAAAHSVGNRTDHHLRDALLAGQAALALILLFAATLLGKNVRALAHIPRGFNPDALIAVRMVIPARYATHDARAIYVRHLVDAVAQVPGVASVTATQGQFALGSSSQSFFAVRGESLPDSTGVIANIRHIMPGALRVLGSRLVAGREFESGDRPGGNPVALVSASFARERLSGHALGARLRRTALPEYPWMDVVGVVEDVKDAGLGVDLGPAVYVDIEQESGAVTGMAIVARLAHANVNATRDIQKAIWRVDAMQPLNRIATVEALERESAATPRFQALVVMLFGVGAFVLVIGGIYAVTLFSVLKRTREIGVRAALGAAPAALVRNAVWRGTRPLLFGAALGLIIAVPAVRVMQRSVSQTFGVGDLPLLAGVLVALVAAAVLSALIPARRAARVPPIVAMRS